MTEWQPTDPKGDDWPRYTAKRLRLEIERAKQAATMEERERCAKVARDYAASCEAALCHYGSADKDAGRGRQEGHINAGNEIAEAILAPLPSPPKTEAAE
jgi:hypothetical protein